MDPFSGSASTLIVAKKLGRRFLGFEMSEEYSAAGTERLNAANPGDELTGAAEPKMSAPKTWQGKPNKRTRKATESLQKTKPPKKEPLSDRIETIIDEAIHSAWKSLKTDLDAEAVLADEALAEKFFAACEKLGLPGSPEFFATRLTNLNNNASPQQQFAFD